MVANISPADPHARPWWWGQSVKIQLFQNMVMLHIKINAITKCSNSSLLILKLKIETQNPLIHWFIDFNYCIGSKRVYHSLDVILSDL